MTPQNPLLSQLPAHQLPLLHQALETRFAGRLVNALTESSAALPHAVQERLRVARDQALNRARAARRTQVAGSVSSSVSSSGGGIAILRGGAGPGFGLPEWLSALMPLVVLVVGLLLISQLNVREQIQVAADIDTQLLGDDLPPAAYADPGFVHYLRRGPAP